MDVQGRQRRTKEQERREHEPRSGAGQRTQHVDIMAAADSPVKHSYAVGLAGTVDGILRGSIHQDIYV